MRLAQLIVFGITTGLIYALVGLGWGVIYNMTGVLNVAQGEFVMLGGVGSAFFSQTLDVSLPTAGILALAMVLVVALAIEFLAIVVVRGRSRVAPVLMTLASVFVISDVARRVFGSDAFAGAPLLTGPPIMVPGVDVSVPRRVLPIWLLAIAMFAAYAIFNKTRLGKLMRAASEDPRGARLMGVNTAAMARTAFLIAGFVGAVAGFFLLTVIPLGFGSGLALGVKGFIALALAGMSRPLGALGGGLALGITESLVAGYLSSQYAEVVAYVVLITVLLFSPTGLMSLRLSLPSGRRRVATATIPRGG